MSDEQPPEVGSRRRRREIREARERERAAQQERESAVRRLSSSSTAGTTSSGRRGTGQQAQPEQSTDAPALFDQETATPKDQRRSRRLRQQPAQSSTPQDSSAPAGSPQAGPTPRQQTSSAPSVASASSSASAGQGFISRRERRRRSTPTGGGGPLTSETHADVEQPSGPPQATPPGARPAAAAPASTSEETQQNQAVPPAGAPADAPTAEPQQPQTPPGRVEEPPTGEAAPEAEPTPLPSATSPATPFEHVVAPHSAASPEPEEAHYEPEYEEYEDFHDYHEADWEGDYQEHEYDEDGTPVLVGASGYGRGYQTVAPMEGRVSRSLLKQRKAKRRRRNITLGIIVLAFAGVLFWLFSFLQGLFAEEEIADYDQVAGETVEFEIYPDEGLASVQHRLVDEGIIASPEAFQQALEDYDGDTTHHARTYILREQMPAADALDILLEDGPPVTYFNINPGYHLDEILEVIAAAPGTEVSLEELQELSQNPEQFGLPEEAQDLEGFIAAGEYQPELEASAEEILEEVVAPTFQRLEDAGVTDPEEQWETIIVASLITAEANNSLTEERSQEERFEDYRIMAGAIQNRINNPSHEGIGGLLQIDATVNYGIGLTGDLHFPEEERLNEDNEYNTYVHPGLPPGPIGAPVADTIEAAADPADTDAYFWVTVNPVTGETRFNQWYDDHVADTEEFLQFCQENPGACGPADVESAEEELEE
ncbi:endolytic transglycosylase MltG [Nesterenkonia ebinurensis]|uniref:endolytic transglycosylase MltG n=1 Tax=Nesterenkonia ebinurensis TaxID=2608252 RepID=UPI00123CD61B|nr:endolytic transglycosylase MltG [Nesterenkonia ebinurensis]